MTFRDYCSIIAESVAETGYDSFLPSACVPGFAKDEFHVLEGGLSEKGEERVALSWAESLPKNSTTVFLAFRAGERRVTVLELKENAVIAGLVIRVNPDSEVSK